jgi:hypothetical protein
MAPIAVQCMECSATYFAQSFKWCAKCRDLHSLICLTFHCECHPNSWCHATPEGKCNKCGKVIEKHHWHEDDFATLQKMLNRS